MHAQTVQAQASGNPASESRPSPQHRSDDGRRRTVIERVEPSIDAGRFPIKRVAGESVRVEADVFADGHDRVACSVLSRPVDRSEWSESAMRPLPYDRWAGEFIVEQVGTYEYSIQAWIDRFATWTYNLKRRADADQDLSAEFIVGAMLVEEAAEDAPTPARDGLQAAARVLRDQGLGDQRLGVALSDRLTHLMRAHSPRRFATILDRPLRVAVERPKARFSTWYEMFPRSAATQSGKHGTFKDVEARLPYISSMGFDVLYLPPIHPIGRSFRKGPNNSVNSTGDDLGSPWAIGGPEGGHKSIHPQLGSIEDFDRLVSAARRFGVDVSIDIAFQSSPDHPYAKEHPQWFRHRPDGSVQYAENPPKKYQDIYPFDFETEQWQSLWHELRDVVKFWAEHGVRIFRVDNPHTKPFAFWEWLISDIRSQFPDAIFLAEAFTRRNVMYRLAKAGFSQSYTYFAWRNSVEEIRKYFTELTQPPVSEFFRANAWPNTPDILTEFLQSGGRPAFAIRAVLAATLCGNYGIYGPAFELCESRAVRAGSEEYLDSEKYQIRSWDIHRADSLRGLLTRLNNARRQNPALQQDRTLRFHDSDNPSVICYSKSADQNVVVAVVNTDPHRAQPSTIALNLEALGLPAGSTLQMHDVLSGEDYTWHGGRALVILDPAKTPAHVMVAKTGGQRSERDFEYADFY